MEATLFKPTSPATPTPLKLKSSRPRPRPKPPFSFKTTQNLCFNFSPCGSSRRNFKIFLVSASSSFSYLVEKKRVEEGGSSTLESIQNSLIHEEDNIIYNLLESAKYCYNVDMYEHNAFFMESFHGYLVEFMVRETEKIHAQGDTRVLSIHSFIQSCPSQCSHLRSIQRLDESENLTLDAVRHSLIRKEDTIIYSLLERAQYCYNADTYDHNAFSMEEYHGTVIEFILRETEKLYAQMGWYKSPEERPFFPTELPEPNLSPMQYPKVLHLVADSININKKIWEMYFNDLLPRLVKVGNDGNGGSAAVCDTTCPQESQWLRNYVVGGIRGHPLSSTYHQGPALIPTQTRSRIPTRTWIPVLMQAFGHGILRTTIVVPFPELLHVHYSSRSHPLPEPRHEEGGVAIFMAWQQWL